MHRPDIAQKSNGADEQIGLSHFAVSVGSKKKVDALTEQIRDSGHKIIEDPRTTGDGYYESVVLDPENNTIEITA
jgi:lactoylglutathione lyase